MKIYNADEQNKINEWLKSVGASHLIGERFYEYEDGQLLEIVEASEDSLLTWDEWQHLQALMGMKIPLEESIRFVGMLSENGIEVLELKTEKSKDYYNKRGASE